MIDQQTCAEKIRWVARAIHNAAVFNRRAQAAAELLGPDAIDTLATLFHSEHSPPVELADQFPGLGDWIAARQFAIFEIFYHLGEAALPVLRRVAFGEYDWTQGNALEILCRLAADGIDREATIVDIRLEIPRLRHEALLYSLGPLLAQAKDNPSLAQLLKHFDDLRAYQEAAEELRGNG